MADLKSFYLSDKNGLTSIGYTIIKCYGYRNAWLKNGLKVDRESLKDIENEIFDCRVGFGNHCVVVLRNNFNSEPLAFYFSDMTVSIGSVENIVEESTF